MTAGIVALGFVPTFKFDEVEAKSHSFADMDLGQDFEAAHADAVGKPFSAGRGLDDGFLDGRLRQLDLPCGKAAVNGAELTAGAAILIVQAGADSAGERIVVHAIERLYLPSHLPRRTTRR